MPSKLRIGVLVPPCPDVTATLVAAADQQARSLVPALRAIQAEGILSIERSRVRSSRRRQRPQIDPTPAGVPRPLIHEAPIAQTGRA